MRSHAPGRVVEECARQMDAFMDAAIGLIGTTKAIPCIATELYATQEEFMRASAALGLPVGGGTLG